MDIFSYLNDKNKIYNMDAFDLMKQLPDTSVQLILTDPPYGIQYQNNLTRKKLPRLAGDAGIDYLTFAQQCYRILEEDSHAYFFTRYDKYPFHYECLVKAGFSIKNCLVIEKGLCGNSGDLYGSYASNCEWIIFCHKGRRAFNKTRLLKNKKPAGKPAHRYGNPIQEYKTRFFCCWFGKQYPKATYNPVWRVKQGFQHPTMKNVECLGWLIQISSNPGDIVFDPFIGSGSTALAAIQTGRFFLGSEIEASYCELAQSRILKVQFSGLQGSQHSILRESERVCE
jgi:site-specific DNA-methyltransferase (adenine-specific)